MKTMTLQQAQDLASKPLQFGNEWHIEARNILRMCTSIHELITHHRLPERLTKLSCEECDGLGTVSSADLDDETSVDLCQHCLGRGEHNLAQLPVHLTLPDLTKLYIRAQQQIAGR